MTSRLLVALFLLLAGALSPATVSQAAAPTSTVVASAAAAAPSAARRAGRPNVVMIMTDDMAASDLRYMPRTRRLIGRAGTTFDDGLSPNPMCCPARATLLTGQESHNNGVWSNGGSRGGYAALPRGSRLPEWLQDAGYRTAFLGKHLNGFRAGEADSERGWDVLDALVAGVYSYRSFTTWDNGRLSRVRDGYVTTHLQRGAERVIRRFDRHDRDPFFLWVSHVGPHTSRDNQCRSRCWGPPIPAARDRGDLAGTPAPTRSLPSFNHANDATKPPFLRKLSSVAPREVDRQFQRRIEALRSVDRSVADTVRTLRRRDELGRTMLVFTSDNGYLLGQHRYVGKRLPYEGSVRVPLLVRGPGVRAGAHTGQPATSADLSRTIVDVAGAAAPHPLDGVSLVPAFRGEPTGRMASILQTGADLDPEGDRRLAVQPDDRGWLYRGYRDRRWTYARYPDPAGPDTAAFEELYDRDADPDELHNLVDEPGYAGVLQQARQRALQLALCAGDGCHPAWEPIQP
ncbi:sulfatase family protein [Nocardioides sp. GXQ0305]|uniref:sulfatase family protein n=1 Tax=Nocardioides sp. GXQ0305 TaxID=3423912 RepID=UPI003D7CEFD7